MEILAVLMSILFLLFLVALIIVGFYMLFPTEKVINFVMEIYDRINVIGAEPFLDPYGSLVISSYKVIGILFIIMSVCTLLLIIILPIIVIFGGGSMCFGSIDNCWEF